MTRKEQIAEQIVSAAQCPDELADAIAKELALLHDRVDRLANLAADAKQIAAEVERRFDSASFVSAQLAQAERVASAVAGGDAPARDAEAVVEAYPLSYVIAAARAVAKYAEARSWAEVDTAAVSLRAALAAYDSAPNVRSVGTLSSDLTAAAAALSDAAAVQDAALAEAQKIAEREAEKHKLTAKSMDVHDYHARAALDDCARASRSIAREIAALRSSPPLERVTEEDFRQWLEEGIRAGDDLDSALGHCAAAAAESFIILRKPGA